MHILIFNHKGIIIKQMIGNCQITIFQFIIHSTVSDQTIHNRCTCKRTSYIKADFTIFRTIECRMPANRKRKFFLRRIFHLPEHFQLIFLDVISNTKGKRIRIFCHGFLIGF